MEVSIADQAQSPWDVMWEYILDDFESDDDDDSTLPTVSTRGTEETTEDTALPITVIKEQWMKATKGISNFTQSYAVEERDESGSNKYTWRQTQRMPDLREKHEIRKLKWGGFGVKSIASKIKKKDQKVTSGGLLDKASQAAAAIKWEEAGDALIGIFDVVKANKVRIGDQSISDSSSGDSESKVYSYNSVEDDSFSHHDARVDRSARRESDGCRQPDEYDDPESFLNGSKTLDNCFKKPVGHRGSQKKTNRGTNDHKTASTGASIVWVPFSTRAKDAGHGKDTGHGSKNSTNNDDGATQLTRKFACFAKMESNELDAIHQLDDMDTKFFFPSARMVSDSDGQIPISQQLNVENGVMGIPPDKLLGLKGPQTVYSYEYQRKIHMDIAYTKFGVDPHECISIRKFESVPALRPEDGNRVLIQVEASTVSVRDCKIRQGKLKSEYEALPLTPGVDIVGKVIGIAQSTSSSFSLYPGQSVLSLVQAGGNSRYISLYPESLVKVPEGIDPAQVVCLCDTYLSAFQSLHYGQVASSRHAENSLEGKTVLIVGSIASTFGKAVIELAVDGNAAIVFATAKRKHWRMLLALGIIPLPNDSSDWLNRVEGTVDLALIVGTQEAEQSAEYYERTLRPDGRLIFCGCEELKETAKVSNERFVVFDVYQQWEKGLEVSKRDIQHLIGLLEKEKLRPKVLDRLPLAKVADAQKFIESKVKLSGFLVCEPWMQAKKRALYL